MKVVANRIGERSRGVVKRAGGTRAATARKGREVRESYLAAYVDDNG